jgi:hypothetical protein
MAVVFKIGKTIEKFKGRAIISVGICTARGV